MSNWPKLSIFIAFVAIPLGWRAERRYRQLPRLWVAWATAVAGAWPWSKRFGLERKICIKYQV